MAADDPYLRDVMYGDTDTDGDTDGDDVTESHTRGWARFAALSLSDQAEDEEGPEAAPEVGGVEGEVEDEDGAGSTPGGDGDPGDPGETSAENGWTWGNGGGGVRPPPSGSKTKKKPILLAGEKRALKKRHMAEIRAARSEARVGFSPDDVRKALERVVARAAPEWTSMTCGPKEAKMIVALSRCFPGLECDVRMSAASGRQRKGTVVVRNTNVLIDPEDGSAGNDDEARALSERAAGTNPGDDEAAGATARSTPSGRSSSPSLPPGPAPAAPAYVYVSPAAAKRAEAITAAVPTRDEYLRDPARLARVAKALGRGGGETGRPRHPPAGRRGTGAHHAPEVARRGRSRAGPDGAPGGTRGAARGVHPVAFSRGGTLRDDTWHEVGHVANPRLDEDASVDAQRPSVDARGDARSSYRNEDEDEDEDENVTAGTLVSASVRPWSSSSYVGERTRRGAPTPAAAGGDFATFEAHTRGFGSRMMEKMGFTPGRGLGPDGGGVREPIASRQRPKNLGLGAE